MLKNQFFLSIANHQISPENCTHEVSDQSEPLNPSKQSRRLPLKERELFNLAEVAKRIVKVILNHCRNVEIESSDKEEYSTQFEINSSL